MGAWDRMLKITLNNSLATTYIALTDTVLPGEQYVFTKVLMLDYDEDQLQTMYWQMYHVTKGLFGQVGSCEYLICQSEIILNIDYFTLTLGGAVSWCNWISIVRV